MTSEGIFLWSTIVPDFLYLKSINIFDIWWAFYVLNHFMCENVLLLILLKSLFFNITRPQRSFARTTWAQQANSCSHMYVWVRAIITNTNLLNSLYVSPCVWVRDIIINTNLLSSLYVSPCELFFIKSLKRLELPP